jgi:hypothetical protein
MSKNKFKLWENYDELEKQYYKNIKPEAPPPVNLFDFKPKPALDPKLGLGTSYSVFLYAVNTVQSLIEEEIKSFEKDSKTLASKQLKSDCDNLMKILDGAVAGEFEEKKMNTITEQFQKAAELIIEKYEPQIEHNQSWAPFLKNLALLFSVVGTLPALFSIGSRAINGHYSFFDKKTIDREKLDAPLPLEPIFSNEY